MASPSTWAWPRRTLGDSVIKLSNSPSSSFTSSIIFTFHTIHKKQTRLTNLSLDSSSSSSSSSLSTSVCYASHDVSKRERKSAKSLTFGDNSKKEVSVNSSKSQKRPTFSFKLLFGRRSIRRRILFGSRKVRSIILLNVITFVYGAIVPARTWFGALMSILGVAMLESSGSPPSVGDLLNFLSAVFFGIHLLRTEHISRGTNKENFLPLLGYEVCVLALFSILWYFLGGWFGGIPESNPSSWTWTIFRDWMLVFPWIPALYTGIFSTGLCLWVEMAAMCDVSATETAIIYGLEPVWGAGLAWFLLGERWGTTGWVGAALVLGGSLMVQIFGSSSSNLTREGEDSKQEDHLLVSDEQSGFSTSPFVVNSRKDVPDGLKK